MVKHFNEILPIFSTLPDASDADNAQALISSAKKVIECFKTIHRNRTESFETRYRNISNETRYLEVKKRNFF